MKIALIFLLISSGYAEAKDFLPSTFKVEFAQEYKTSLKGKVKKSSGNIQYKYPSQIRFEVTTPDKVVFVSNQEMSWYYQAPFIEGEPGELNVRKTGKTGLSRFFDVLKKGLKTNQFYEVKNNKETSEINFVEKFAKELDIKGALITFKNEKMDFENIKNMELTYLDGHKIKLHFTEMKTGLSMNKENFVFKAPKNTRINQ